MTALWLWLNSTELNWTLNVLVVSENCFAFALFLRFSITADSLALSRSLSGNLALSLNFWFSEQPRFLYRTLNSDGRLVSQWLRTHTDTNTLREHFVSVCKARYCCCCCVSFNFAFVAHFKLEEQQQLTLSLSQCPTAALSLSLSFENNHFTLNLNTIRISMGIFQATRVYSCINLNCVQSELHWMSIEIL